MENNAEQFQIEVYQGTERLFAENDVEVVIRLSTPDSRTRPRPAVQLTHKPTGISVICDRYPSHRANLAIARLQLKIACDSPHQSNAT